MSSPLGHDTAFRPAMPTYSCDTCHALISGPEGLHGSMCPRCETPGSTLRNVAMVTPQMLERSERAS
jgi:hypothetical protein